MKTKSCTWETCEKGSLVWIIYKSSNAKVTLLKSTMAIVYKFIFNIHTHTHTYSILIIINSLYICETLSSSTLPLSFWQVNKWVLRRPEPSGNTSQAYTFSWFISSSSWTLYYKPTIYLTFTSSRGNSIEMRFIINYTTRRERYNKLLLGAIATRSQ